MKNENLLDHVVAWLERDQARGRRRVALSPATAEFLRQGPPRSGAPAPAAVVPPAAVTPPSSVVPPPRVVHAVRREPVPPAPVVAPAAASVLPALDCSACGWSELTALVEGCSRCKLHGLGRQRTVFGEGDAKTRLMFIGEGPGAEEDEQGRPFVGPAGQLLTKMIEAMHLNREQVYLAYIVKCRPPNNRPPEPDEAEACLPVLRRQIALIRPEVIVLLGAIPLGFLLGLKGIMKERGQWRELDGIPVMPTYHPSFLLRVPVRKREAWADLQSVMQRLGL